MDNVKNIANSILVMAAERGTNKTICPSEVAKALFPANWRNYMEAIREAAIKLQRAGKVTITQKGHPITTEHIKGPIRIKIAESE